MTRDKATLRQEIWETLRASGDARFPGTRGRIPNFRGAEAAADHLLEHPALRTARVVKCNPDSPQRPVRAALLRRGVTVVLAAPKLATAAPFVVLDPALIPAGSLWSASSIKGGMLHGVATSPEDCPALDAIVTGCVGITPAGERLGKGGGYSDLEYAVLRELGLVEEDTPILTTVHPAQVRHVGDIPLLPHDITVDAFATPEGLVSCRRQSERPIGVDMTLLPRERLDAIPVLAARARIAAERDRE